jgi:ankyrin repeat protein
MSCAPAQLRRMLLAGANASTPDCIGVTPLHVAATVGNLTAVRVGGWPA